MKKGFKPLSMLVLTLILAVMLAGCGDSTATTASSGTPGSVLGFLTPTTAPVTTTANATTSGSKTTVATTTAATTAAATTNTAAQTTATVLNRYNPVFAAYKDVAVITTFNFPKYNVASNLSNVTNLADFSMTDVQKKLLAQNYFVVEPADFKQFFQAYESFRYDQIPTYVSTDSVAHVYHLLFDKLLRETEKGYLINDLNALSKILFDTSVKQYDAVSGTELKAAATRNVAFTAVALKLANPKATVTVPAYATKLVDDEMKLIDGTAGIAKSPIMGNGYEEDYSQYIPRGHYTKSDELKNYFRAMIWYGRLTFRTKYADETQSALLLAQAIQTGTGNGRKASDLWQLIYEPTAFFVGNSDDLTYQDYLNLAKIIWGDAGSNDAKSFADKTKLDTFIKSVDALPPPKVNSMITYIKEDQESQIKGMRVMGQRFTIDAYIFQNLIYRRVGTDSNPRDLPKGLDVFAALGGEQAYKLLDQAGDTQFANYKTQLDKVKSQVAALGTDTWTQNLYWAWLHTLRPLIEKRGEAYPLYMQNEAWQRKQLVTSLGSWTELKHDTILYAKQVYAEKGGGPDELPTGFVEPEPTFYARMASLANMTRTGLVQRNLINKEFTDLLQKLEKDALTLKTISEKELSGQKLTDDEVNFIAFWGATIEGYTYAAADADANTGRKYLDQQDAAVVADVATGLNNALEEGTGRVNLIYVAVPVNGKVILTEGAVYSQYEFKVNPSNRLTDEAWQKMLNDGKAPALEDWKKSYMADGTTRKKSN